MTRSAMHVLAIAAIASCWAAFGLTWLAGAAYNASNAPAERTRTSFASGAVIGAVIVVGISRAVPAPDWRAVLLTATWARLLGLAILVGATAFTLWARWTLGIMWSAAPMVKQEHQLRTGGPYAITRHPIYTGMLGMMIGSTLLAGGGRAVPLFPVFLVLFEFKLRIEERLMLAEFPDVYPAYRARVPRLMPGVRPASRPRTADAAGD